MHKTKIQAQDINAGDKYRGKLVLAVSRSGDDIYLRLMDGPEIIKKATQRMTIERF